MYHQKFLAAEPKACSKCGGVGNKPCYNCGRRCLTCPNGHHSHNKSIECKKCHHKFKERTTYKKKGHKKKKTGVCKPKKHKAKKHPPLRIPSLNLTPEELSLIRSPRSPPASLQSPETDDFGFLTAPLDLSRSDSIESLIRDPEPNDLNVDALEMLMDPQTKIMMLEIENEELKEKIELLKGLLGKTDEELEEIKRVLAEPAIENPFSV